MFHTLSWTVNRIGILDSEHNFFSLCTHLKGVANRMRYHRPYVMGANSINIFKNRMDNHWYMQDFMYDFESELTAELSTAVLINNINQKLIHINY